MSCAVMSSLGHYLGDQDEVDRKERWCENRAFELAPDEWKDHDTVHRGINDALHLYGSEAERGALLQLFIDGDAIEFNRQLTCLVSRYIMDKCTELAENEFDRTIKGRV